MLLDLKRAAEAGFLRELDFHFAKLMVDLHGRDCDAVLLGAFLVSRQAGEGDVCISLADYAETPLLEKAVSLPAKTFIAPPSADWCRALRESPVVGRPGDRKPLILDRQNRLYLGRFWFFENALAENLKQRLSLGRELEDVPVLRSGLDRLFGTSDEKPNWQKMAAAMAARLGFCVISGGPGTGKTTTVARILALLVEQALPRLPRIALVAPTGKAAARLSEAIKRVKQTLPCQAAVKAAIPDHCSTIHRLLGANRHRPGFRHHGENPLHLDILVVDEASMIDLPLMARLLDALPVTARLILLGDRDQLSSVEAGNVLGDICGRDTHPGYSPRMAEDVASLTGHRPPVCLGEPPLIADAIALLRFSYRFGDRSGIGALSVAVNRGEAGRALQILDGQDHGDVTLISPSSKGLWEKLIATAVAAYRVYLNAPSPIEALELFQRFRVLCVVREGPYGIHAMNQRIEQALHRAGLIATREHGYRGRPVLVTRNDYQRHLYNGDIGMFWPERENGGRMQAYFMAANGELRGLSPARLPEHQTVYAMTVHKSQGSEFDRVLLLLPEKDTPILTRELIYTGITRARQRVDIWGNGTLFRQAVDRPTSRRSGLKEKLWDNAEETPASQAEAGSPPQA